MKIEFRAATTGGAGYTALADETTAALAEKISGYQPRLAKSAQEEPGFGAAGIAVFDTGNQKWTLGFMIDRVHASPDAAVQFIATHANAVGSIGNLDLKITVGAIVLFMAACTITEFSPDPASDQSTRCRYGFTGGNYTLTAP